MYRNSIFFFLVVSIVLVAGTVSLTAQDTEPSSDASEQETVGVPEITGFVRFRDGEAIFGTIQRIGRDRIRLLEKKEDGQITVQYDQLPPHERVRLHRELMIEEEKHPPRVTGLELELRGGEVVRGLQVLPGESSSSNAESKMEGASEEPSSSNDDASKNEKPTNIILLTPQEGKRQFSVGNIVNKKEIEINPMTVQGAKDLYQSRQKRMDKSSAAEHWELAGLCMQINLYQEAIKHLEQAQELDSSYEEGAQLRIEIIKQWIASAGSTSGTSSGSSGNASGASSSDSKASQNQ